jgi:probable HAF family extracellular repeat protein
MFRSLRDLLFAITIILGSFSLPSSGAIFTFKTISVSGALYTTARGINNSGEIVGYYVDSGGVTHGFSLLGKTLTTIDDPNGTATFCEGVNSNGEIVGEYTQSDGNNHGFLYQNGTFTDIGIGAISGAFGINDQGIIVGGFLNGAFSKQLGFIFDGTSYTTVNPPGTSFVSVSGINNLGIMTVIEADARAIYHAFLFDGTTFTNIDAPGFRDSYAVGINNLGEVSMTVDNTQGSKEIQQGAVLEDGTYLVFSYRNLQGVLTSAGGLNDNGRIVGSFESFSQRGLVLQGFEATFQDNGSIRLASLGGS